MSFNSSIDPRCLTLQPDSNYYQYLEPQSVNDEIDIQLDSPNLEPSPSQNLASDLSESNLGKVVTAKQQFNSSAQPSPPAIPLPFNVHFTTPPAQFQFNPFYMMNPYVHMPYFQPSGSAAPLHLNFHYMSSPAQFQYRPECMMNPYVYMPPSSQFFHPPTPDQQLASMGSQPVSEPSSPIRKSEWKREEIEILLNTTFGMTANSIDWSQIHEMLPNRKESAVKVKWYRLRAKEIHTIEDYDNNNFKIYKPKVKGHEDKTSSQGMTAQVDQVGKTIGHATTWQFHTMNEQGKVIFKP